MLRNIDRKNSFTIALVMLGAYIGSWGITSIFFDNPTPVSWVLFVVGGGIVVTASVVGITQLLDRTIKPVMDEFAHGFQDDIDALRNGRVTWAVWQAILTFIAGTAFIILVLRFHKMEATWFGIPVWIPSVLVSGIMSYVVSRTSWFNDSHFETPAWVYIVAISGFAVAMILGISQTEDVRLLNLGYSTENGGYNYYQFNTYNYYGDSRGYSESVDFDLPECEGDECTGMGYVICGIAFVVFVLLLIIGSAFIPSFWLFSGMIFVGMMVLIAMNSLMYRPYRRYQH